MATKLSIFILFFCFSVSAASDEEKSLFDFLIPIEKINFKQTPNMKSLKDFPGIQFDVTDVGKILIKGATFVCNPYCDYLGFVIEYMGKYFVLHKLNPYPNVEQVLIDGSHPGFKQLFDFNEKNIDRIQNELELFFKRVPPESLPEPFTEEILYNRFTFLQRHLTRTPFGFGFGLSGLSRATNSQFQSELGSGSYTSSLLNLGLVMESKFKVKTKPDFYFFDYQTKFGTFDRGSLNKQTYSETKISLYACEELASGCWGPLLGTYDSKMTVSPQSDFAFTQSISAFMFGVYFQRDAWRSNFWIPFMVQSKDSNNLRTEPFSMDLYNLGVNYDFRKLWLSYLTVSLGYNLQYRKETSGSNSTVSTIDTFSFKTISHDLFVNVLFLY